MPEKFWYKCPICGYHHMLKLREDTKLVNFPGYCKMCKTESIIIYDTPNLEHRQTNKECERRTK